MAELLVAGTARSPKAACASCARGVLEIGVIRHGGKYYAYRNHCPHQGGPACEGLRMPQVKETHRRERHLSRQDLRRDRHAHRLPLARLRVPPCGRRPCRRQALRLQKFEVVERDGEVYVASDARRRSRRWRASSRRCAPMPSSTTGSTPFRMIRSARCSAALSGCLPPNRRPVRRRGRSAATAASPRPMW